MAVFTTCISEGTYARLTSPDRNLYSTVGATSHSSSGAKSAVKSGKSSHLLRLAAVGLGLLCAILLMATIALCVLYTRERGLEVLNDQNCTWRDYKEHLQRDYNSLSNEKDQLQRDYNSLSNEKDQLQRDYNSLSNEKDQLQRDYNSLSNEKDQLQRDYNSLSNEKDQLQRDYNSLSNEKDQLQRDYNSLSNEKDQLQRDYNSLSNEKDQLQRDYISLSNAKDQLQRNYISLSNAKNQLQIDYNRVYNQRDQKQRDLNILRNEKAKLQGDYNRLSNERNQLQRDYNRLSRRCQLRRDLNSRSKSKHLPVPTCVYNDAFDECYRLFSLSFCTEGQCITCPEGWKQLSSKCYFFSTVRKSWEDSLQDCKLQGADLVIIRSQEEQEFINQHAKGGHHWIGLKDSANRTFEWVDGTLLQQAFWKAGSPDENRRARCVLTGPGEERWADAPCDFTWMWICETDASCV
ncbi:low affinity immunoglobulin epsilon Fc receptor-like [Anguilla rostrata]|uniref:low affinity immunoglobulin epsilon Fc receptor-like n=1 Tax=Anguilla rostrata TaxID=7938 RepID=UPI0030D1F39B